VSTRKLIIAALLCGMAILIAGAFQFIQIANDQHSGPPGNQSPTVTTVASR
jgi:hypothetical protein